MTLCYLVAATFLPALLAACSWGTADTPATSPQADNSPSSEEPADAPDVDGWQTDWSKRTIDLGELRKGIGASDPRDVIPPLDDPAFETVDAADDWLEDREPIAMLELDGAVRGYPLRILTWHEIVNEEFAGTPVAVTFCPLCNTAIGFDRRVDGQTLRFGVSGLLRNSDLVMWDDRTESLWQQVTGEAIVGELAGTALELIATPVVSWGDFRARFPDAEVLSRETGHRRAYGRNPYVGYDSENRPFLFNGELDPRYPPMERVIGVTVGEEHKAYPFSIASAEKAINDSVGGRPIVVLWGADDTASALDEAEIADGRGVGVGVAYFRTMNGRELILEPSDPGSFRDRETGSTWDLFGNATAGALSGERLLPVPHTNHFWFAWAAFNPEAPVYAPEGG